MFKKILKSLFILVVIITILNIPVTTKQGVNYELKTIKIPLYVKITEYLDRDYWYRALEKDVTKGKLTGEERVLALFEWVVENIHNLPAGFDVVDDHTLNIITRRYGTPDQKADVFATLCVYSGMPAFCQFDIDAEKEKRKHHGICYVFLDNKWKIFDLSRNALFLNDKGKVASIEDIISGRFAVRGGKENLGKAFYADYFSDLKPVKKTFVSKAEKQAPIPRIKYELKNIIQNIH